MKQPSRCYRCGKMFPPIEERDSKIPEMPKEIFGFPVKLVCSECMGTPTTYILGDWTNEVQAEK